MRLKETVKIGLADSQSIFVEGIKRILTGNNNARYEIKWDVSSGESLLKKVEIDPVDVLLTDLCLYEIDGIDILNDLKILDPNLRIMIFTQYAQTKFIKTAFLEGADGYLLKSDEIDNLFNGINTVLEGKTFMGNGISIGPKRTKVLPHDKNSWECEDPFLIKHKLTTREHEILVEICTGKTNKEIAKKLYISDQTVSVHRKNIMRKFNVNSTKTLQKVAANFNFQNNLSAV